MSNIFTVNSMATAYADRQLAHQNLQDPQRNLLRKRTEYDFKVTGFNLATAAAIVTLALAVFTSSVAIFVLGVLTYNIRKAFMRGVEDTALLPPGQVRLGPNVMNRIANLNPVQRRNEIAAHLEINDAAWQVMQYQLFDFKVWMNWTPSAPRANAPVIGAPPAEPVVGAPPAAPEPVAEELEVQAQGVEAAEGAELELAAGANNALLDQPFDQRVV